MKRPRADRGKPSFEAVLERFRATRCREDPALPADIRRLLEAIHEHLFSPDLNVEQLKRKCEIRDNNVTSRFRREVGLPIRAYIEARRLEAAACLLQEHIGGVFDVSHAVGYEYPQTFYRAWQRKFGCTPAAYQRGSSSSGPEGSELDEA